MGGSPGSPVVVYRQCKPYRSANISYDQLGICGLNALSACCIGMTTQNVLYSLSPDMDFMFHHVCIQVKYLQPLVSHRANASYGTLPKRIRVQWQVALAHITRTTIQKCTSGAAQEAPVMLSSAAVVPGARVSRIVCDWRISMQTIDAYSLPIAIAYKRTKW